MMRRPTILTVLCLAALLINLDITIVNVALPSLVRELNASTTDLQWVVDAYNLVFAALVLTAGSLSDRQGRRGALVLGLVIFGGASLLGSFCTTASELIAARAVMGLGAAIIFPVTLSLISNVFTERAARARAIGLWTATAGAGVALGPIVGGWLLEHFSWGSVFLFMAPIAGLVAILAVAVVPTSRNPDSAPVDRAGLGLSSVGMGLVVLAVIEAPVWGWGSLRTLASFTCGSVVLALFTMVERRAVHPMLDIRLFRNLRFSAASGSISAAFFALFGFIFLVTQYFQFLKAYSPLSTGVRLLPVAVSIAISSVVGTRLAVRSGSKAVVTVGLLCLGAAFVWISTLTETTGYSAIAGQMLVLGTGIGMATASATEAIMGAVSADKAGVGAAVNDATRLVGGTLGVAVIGSVSASLYTDRLATTLPGALPHDAARAAGDSVGAALRVAEHLAGLGLQHLAGTVDVAAVHAFLHGFQAGCLLAGGVVAAGAIFSWTLLPARPAASLGSDPLASGYPGMLDRRADPASTTTSPSAAPSAQLR
jgi:EmrB/QacA subfamily drug resistance transporter